MLQDLLDRDTVLHSLQVLRRGTRTLTGLRTRNPFDDTLAKDAPFVDGKRSICAVLIRTVVTEYIYKSHEPDDEPRELEPSLAYEDSLQITPPPYLHAISKSERSVSQENTY